MIFLTTSILIFDHQRFSSPPSGTQPLKKLVVANSVISSNVFGPKGMALLQEQKVQLDRTRSTTRQDKNNEQ